MKFLLTASCLCFSALLLLAGFKNKEENNTAIRVMSYNIKFDNKADTVNGWAQRRQRLTHLAAFYAPDFMGIQEGQHHQVLYLKQHLDQMNFIGKGREDGKTKGEYSALFYNTRRFKLVNHSDSTMWLSPTPSSPGKGWDASYIRILTWGKFQNKQTGRMLYAFNTHLDNDGTTARKESARLILKTIKKIAKGYPVILTGDFNSTEKDPPHAILTQNSSYLKDAYHASRLPAIGPVFTYEGFKTLGTIKRRRIDYIFVSKKIQVLTFATISDFRAGRYPSDHLPIIADLIIRDF